MAKDQNIIIYPEDKITALPDPELGLGSKITITRATPVEITDAKVITIYRTWKKTIKEVLDENGIELLGQDSVSPDISNLVLYDQKIKITRVAEVEVTEKEAIEYKTIKKNSVDLEKGQTKTETKGINGEKEVKYKVKRVDGVEVSREKIDTKIMKEAVNEVQIIGIGPKLAKSGPYLDLINSAAKKYLINGTALMCLMMAESNGNRLSGYPDGPYQGLFQYSPSYWASVSNNDITDAAAQIDKTAYLLTHGQSSRWPPWSRCRDK